MMESTYIHLKSKEVKVFGSSIRIKMRNEIGEVGRAKLQKHFEVYFRRLDFILKVIVVFWSKI